MATGNNIAEKIAHIKESKAKINARLVDLGVALETDDLATMATKIESDITNQGAVQATVTEGKTYTIPKGYHNGSGTVTGLSDTEGDAEKYKLQEKNITPTKSNISVTPDSGYYGLSSVTVNPIPATYQDVTAVTASAGDVLTGKTIVTSDGTVTVGTMTNNGAVSKTLTTTETSYTVPAGYHNGEGTVSIVTETKEATPTKSSQNITPTTGKVLSKVTVNPIPAEYITTTDATATADKMLQGYTAYVNGSKVTGNIQTKTINETVGYHKNVLIPEGYYTGNENVVNVSWQRDPAQSYWTETVAVTTGGFDASGLENDGYNNYVVRDLEPEEGKAFGNILISIPETAYDLRETTILSGLMDANGNFSEKTLSGQELAYMIPEGVTVGFIGTTLAGYDKDSPYMLEGLMTNYGVISQTITGLNSDTSTYTLQPGYYAEGSTISITNDIENLLAEI